jgi:hypothetical protein
MTVLFVAVHESGCGTSRHFVAGQHLVAIGAQRTLSEQYQSSSIYGEGPTDLPAEAEQELGIFES